MALPRMRTVKEAMDTIKEADPHTALSEHAIRRLIKNRTYSGSNKRTAVSD